MTYEAVRAMFFYGLPEVEPGEVFSEEKRNREVERLIAIGRFELDRWAYQKAVLGNPDQSTASLDCTYGHVRLIQQEAGVLLSDYLDRKRPTLDSETVRSEIGDLRTNLTNDIKSILPPASRRWRPTWLWVLSEAMGGPVAVFGVIVVAIIAHLIFPVFMEATAVELGKLTGLVPTTATQRSPSQPAAPASHDSNRATNS